MILHVPGGSGPEPAAAPALPSPDIDCTAEPSPVLPAAAHPLESGSPCFHPWASPENLTRLDKIKHTNHLVHECSYTCSYVVTELSFVNNHTNYKLSDNDKPVTRKIYNLFHKTSGIEKGKSLYTRKEGIYYKTEIGKINCREDD